MGLGCVLLLSRRGRFLFYSYDLLYERGAGFTLGWAGQIATVRRTSAWLYARSVVMTSNDFEIGRLSFYFTIVCRLIRSVLSNHFDGPSQRHCKQPSPPKKAASISRSWDEEESIAVLTLGAFFYGRLSRACGVYLFFPFLTLQANADTLSLRNSKICKGGVGKTPPATSTQWRSCSGLHPDLSPSWGTSVPSLWPDRAAATASSTSSPSS